MPGEQRPEIDPTVLLLFGASDSCAGLSEEQRAHSIGNVAAMLCHPDTETTTTEQIKNLTEQCEDEPQGYIDLCTFIALASEMSQEGNEIPRRFLDFVGDRIRNHRDVDESLQFNFISATAEIDIKFAEGNLPSLADLESSYQAAKKSLDEARDSNLRSLKDQQAIGLLDLDLYVTDEYSAHRDLFEAETEEQADIIEQIIANGLEKGLFKTSALKLTAETTLDLFKLNAYIKSGAHEALFEDIQAGVFRTNYGLFAARSLHDSILLEALRDNFVGLHQAMHENLVLTPSGIAAAIYQQDRDRLSALGNTCLATGKPLRDQLITDEGLAAARHMGS